MAAALGGGVRATIVAPHCGGVALSLGGSVLAGSLGERPNAVHVFTFRGRKNADLEEERGACEQARAEPSFLGFEAHDVRAAASSPRRDAVFGPVRSALEAIAWKQADGVVLFPLGIGRDHDHELVHLIGAELLITARVTRMAFYEDLPFAFAEDARAHVQCLPAAIRRSLRPISLKTAPLADKLDLLATYTTRVTLTQRRLIADHHRRHRHERLWVTERAAPLFA